MGQRVGESKSITSCTCRAALRSVESPRFVRAWRTYAYACMRMYMCCCSNSSYDASALNQAQASCVPRVCDASLASWFACLWRSARTRAHGARTRDTQTTAEGTAAARARARRARRGRALLWRYGYGATVSGRVAALRANVCDVARAAPPARSTALAGLCVMCEIQAQKSSQTKEHRY